jgi:hypothetical protein
MDEIAKLYIQYMGKVYRIKVFSQQVTVEQQPGVWNIAISKDDPDEDDMGHEQARTVYDQESGVWNHAAIGDLIDTANFIAECEAEDA